MLGNIGNPADLRILHYPAPALRVRAKPVAEVNEQVREVASRMIELMREAKGVGLAAPQVGLSWRLFVTETPDEDGPRVYINPALTPIGSERTLHEEGCLSLPGIHVEVQRPMAIRLSALDLDGKPILVESDAFPARVWQHEFDHLNGVLIIDKMTPLDRLATRKTIKELEQAARGTDL